ncbi:MAG: glycoside hydrolase family 25 protein [Pedobacter sp.]|nr:glycoside hydrolase family 25 protein [Chitinophagaceae bacterium]
MAKKSSKSGIIFLQVLLALLAISVIVYSIKLIKERQALAKAQAANYAAFGIEMPLNYSLHGIDVSSHQSIIYWPSVKAMKVNNISINFAFIKATEGTNDADKLFAKNWKITKQLGIIHGAYHFFLATKNGAIQAHNFIKITNLQKGDLPPVVDVEQLYGVAPNVMQQRLQQCLDSLESQYHIKPIIYTYIDFYTHFLGEKFDNYPLWIAHYLESDKPRIKRNWLFWQHSEHGHVNGIITSVDCNVFKGDSLEFKSILLKK